MIFRRHLSPRRGEAHRPHRNLISVSGLHLMVVSRCARSAPFFRTTVFFQPKIPTPGMGPWVPSPADGFFGSYRVARSTSQLCLTSSLILLSSPSIGAAAFIDPSPLSWNNYFFGIISFLGFLFGFSFSSMGLVRDRLLSCMGYRGGMTLFSLSHSFL